jgi:hypothetical protein
MEDSLATIEKSPINWEAHRDQTAGEWARLVERLTEANRLQGPKMAWWRRHAVAMLLVTAGVVSACGFLATGGSLGWGLAALSAAACVVSWTLIDCDGHRDQLGFSPYPRALRRYLRSQRRALNQLRARNARLREAIASYETDGSLIAEHNPDAHRSMADQIAQAARELQADWQALIDQVERETATELGFLEAHERQQKLERLERCLATLEPAGGSVTQELSPHVAVLQLKKGANGGPDRG